MAIAFDPISRIVTLDSFNVSASEIWSRWVDWSVLSDNLKYLPAFSQLGGIAPVALYIYLENGWLVRPQEASGLTSVTGNLLVQGGGNPFVPTIGSFASQVILESPVAAQAIEVNSGSGLDAGQDARLTRIHSLLDVIENGLDHAEVSRLILSSATGKVSGAEEGSTIVRFRDNADTKDRIIATVDGEGNRIAVSLDEL